MIKILVIYTPSNNSLRETPRPSAIFLMLTIEKVKKGEELTFDYATTETTVTPDLLNKTCLCQSPNCRKKITGFNDLSLADKMTLITKDITASYLQITDK